MTDALIGYGTGLEVFSSGAFVEIAEVFNVTPGEATTDRVDATHMKSPGRRREYISGLIDSGEASFEINWIPGSPTDVILRDLQTSGENVDWRFIFKNGVTLTVEASVTGFSKAVPLDDKMSATLTLSLSGDEDWGSESAPTNTVLPAISGIAQVGQTLTAWPGVWTGAPTFSYVWKNEGVAIPGATGPTYVPVVGDVGDNITVTISGVNSAGPPVSATSTETAAVIAA